MWGKVNKEGSNTVHLYQADVMWPTHDLNRYHTLLVALAFTRNSLFSQLLIYPVMPLMERLLECFNNGCNLWGQDVLAGMLKIEVVLSLMGDSWLRFQGPILAWVNGSFNTIRPNFLYFSSWNAEHCGFLITVGGRKEIYETKGEMEKCNKWRIM